MKNLTKNQLNKVNRIAAEAMAMSYGTKFDTTITNPAPGVVMMPAVGASVVFGDFFGVGGMSLVAMATCTDQVTFTGDLIDIIIVHLENRRGISNSQRKARINALETIRKAL